MNEIFAVVIAKNINHEGDERSRTHPGHGYPAWSETVHEFKSFKDEKEFRLWVLNHNDYPSFVAYKCTPLTITKNITIEIK